MKYITILLLFFTFVCSSQKSYPYLYQDSVGSQFVILTLEQAQKLDNATEFSPLLWKDHTSYYQLVDSLCEKKLETKNLQIETLKKNIDTITEWSVTYMKSYELCKNNVEILNNKSEVTNDINTVLKDKVSSLEERNNQQYFELKRTKRDMNIAILFGFVATIGAFIISL
jgi:hypothetical protein